MTTQPDVTDKVALAARQRELHPPACALITALLTRDSEAITQINYAVRRNGGFDDDSFVIAVARMAAMMLTDACGSNAQAASLANDYTNMTVRRYIEQVA